MKHTALILVLASCTALAPERLRAAKCDIKDGAADWTDGRNYDKGIAPQPGDEVRVLEGRTVSLDASLDSGSMATVAALKQITLFGPDFSKCGKVVITVAENDTKELTAPFYGIIDNEPTGVVEKRGGGTLQLMNPRFVDTEDHGNNIGRLTVSAGTVCMPTNTPQCSFVCGIVEVAEGATFRLPWRREGESGAYYAQFRGLTGAGAVLTGSDKAMTIRVNGSYDLDFSGTIGEKVSLQCKGLQRLSGTGNRSPFVEVFGGNGDLSGKAVLSVAKIGMKNQSSSIGSSPLMANVGQGTFRYTGTGEVTDKEVLLYSPSGTGDAYPLQLDGGANGALVFTGDWKYSTADPPRMGHIVLSGENSSPCILSNNVAGWTSGERGYSFYLTKRGSGRWRFSDALTGWRGGLAVEEGTVEYESIAETNELCSLGYATVLTEPYTSAWDDDKTAPYAFILGTFDGRKTTTGTMEYIGTRQAVCTTRPFALRGGACLKSRVSGVPMALGNVFAEGTGARKLILDAPAETVNRLADVAERAAEISIVKRGAGCWRLSGEQTASGSLHVEAGRLDVVSSSRPVPYSWFRFTVKETAGQGANFRLQGLALYDAEGRQQNVGLTPAMPSQDEFPDNRHGYVEGAYLNLRPGEACFGRAGYYRFRHEYNNWYTLEKIFLDNARDHHGVPLHTWGGATASGNTVISADDPSSWMRIVMRLTNGAPEIVRYDINKPQLTYPTRWMLEGSADGVMWDVLHEGNSGDAMHKSDSTGGVWYSDGSAWVKGELRPGKGYPLDRSARSTASPALAGVSSVRVDRGATLSVEGEPLTVSAMSVGAGGAGSFRNVNFANAGMLEVGELPGVSGEAPVTVPVDGWGGGDYTRLNGWTLRVNGKVLPAKRLRVSKNSLTVKNRGLMLTVR